MAYTPTVWQDGVTDVNATNMNHLETGVSDAHGSIASLDTRLIAEEGQPDVPAVVNGKWIKGVGGAMVWSDITTTDVGGLSTALAAKIDTSQKAAASGVASLDSASRVVQQATVDKIYASGISDGFHVVARSGVSVWEAGVIPTPDRPIQLTTPRTATLAGNSFWTVAALTNYDWGHWEFVKDVDGYVYGIIRCSEARAAPNVVLSLAANAVAGITRMYVSSMTIIDGHATAHFNSAWNDATPQDITVPTVAYGRKDVTFALTSGALLAGYELAIRVSHMGTHANDTLAVNTLLAGAWLTGA